MKLRNKKTGAIKELQDIMSDMIDNHIVPTLIAIENEWEDYEEPKNYWFIDYDGGIIPFSKMKETATDKSMKQIGNYFESKEEAEEAVERLRAWKRLKDKGFRFDAWLKIKEFKYGNITFGIDDNTNEEDLDLLFGGEE